MVVISIAVFSRGGTIRVQALSVADLLPAGYVKDGSASYQKELQRAIDAAGKAGETLVFRAMTIELSATNMKAGHWLKRAGLGLVNFVPPWAVVLVVTARKRFGDTSVNFAVAQA